MNEGSLVRAKTYWMSDSLTEGVSTDLWIMIFVSLFLSGLTGFLLSQLSMKTTGIEARLTNRTIESEGANDVETKSQRKKEGRRHVATQSPVTYRTHGDKGLLLVAPRMETLCDWKHGAWPERPWEDY